MALASGVLVAAVSFVLLTSAVTTSELRVKGTVEENFRPAYDILVRPEGSFTLLEGREGLVRANYLSGIFGGISLRQYERIKGLEGVEVAAPIANLGYVLPWTTLPVRINDVLDDDPVQIYRIRARWEADRGLSGYPDSTSYVYYTRENPFSYTIGDQQADSSSGVPREVVPGKARTLPVCDTFGNDGSGRPLRIQETPFDRSAPRLDCFSEKTPGSWLEQFGASKDTVGAGYDLSPPMLLAAIDPVQESKLVGLDKTLVGGRYLKEGEKPRIVTQDYDVAGVGSNQARQVPVLVSTKSFVDSTLSLEVERLEVPQGTNVPEVLSDPKRVQGFLPGLSGEVVKRARLPSDRFYGPLLRDLSSKDSLASAKETTAYWSVAPVRYEGAADERLRVLPTRNPYSVWQVPLYPEGFPAPPGNEDAQFRRLALHAGSNRIDDNGLYRTALVRAVGRFDPERLPGFSELSEVPLETYYPPSAEPADARTSRLLGGKPLLPSMNLGDYLSQPPLMLTTLEAAEGTFSNPRFYKGANKEKPISVVRVRVAGVTGADKASLERIRRVAEEIRRETGLAVDITAGSSPTPVTVELPEGKYGRPELNLSEGWVKKGVSVAVLEGVDKKSAALFGLVLVVCGFFLANGALASVRARRREFGVLLSMGWPRSAILAAVLGELALVGLGAGFLGTALAAAVAAVFSLDLPLWRALLVAPVSVVLASASGLLPAALAARGKPIDAILPPVSPPRSAGAARSVAAMALGNLRRLPGRTTLGAAGLFVGVAALTVLLGINLAFYDLLVGTALGDALATSVRPVDYASVALAIVLGGLSVADVLYLNLRERAPELVTLRTCGWEEGHLLALGMFEGMGMGLIGSASGALVGAAAIALLGGGITLQLLALSFLAMLGGVAVSLVASLVPLVALSRLTPPTVLAEE